MKFKKFYWLLPISIIIVFLFQNCGEGFSVTNPIKNYSQNLSSGSNYGLGSGSPSEQKALSILSANCASCHLTGNLSNLIDILNVQHLIDTMQIIPGDPLNSPLIQRVQSNSMPIGSTLSAADKAALVTWVTGTKTAVLPPAPVPLPPVVPPASLTPTYASLQANIFTPKCVGCHGAALAYMAIRVDTYALVLSTAGVVANNPAGSKLYTVVQSGVMPLAPNPMLSSEEIKAISDWITAGALNN